MLQNIYVSFLKYIYRYALSVAFGAVMDNPDLIVACVVGDGEAETGPTAA
jgi:phosphoketolase